MEPHDSNFKQDPKAYADAIALVPTGTKAVPGGNYKKDAKTHKEFPVLRARGEHRVGFGDIQPEDGVTSGMTVVISDEYKPHRIPLYWLPFDPMDDNTSTMIRLKPSKKIEREDHWAAEEIVDPKWFITWGLNGCTITISGDPKEPVIYHSPQVDDVSDKLEAFDAKYLLAKKQNTADPIHVGPDQYGAYFDAEGLKREQQDTMEFSSRSVWTLKAKTRITEGATLLGERQDNDEWHFFCQEWFKIYYEQFQLIGENPSFNKRLVRRCYRVWPSEGAARAAVFVNRITAFT